MNEKQTKTFVHLLKQINQQNGQTNEWTKRQNEQVNKPMNEQIKNVQTK